MKSLLLWFTLQKNTKKVTNEMELSLHIAKEHPPQINCDDCAFSALSVHDMEDHVNVQHKVKELLSCNQCDFDSEDGNELEEHYAKGIHVIKVQNQTIKEPKCSKCQLCEFETKGAKEIDEHVINVHGFKSCDKCEYIAEDMVLMNQHKMKHTESSLYTCGVCEFEATKLAMLNDHIETKHTKQNLWWHENQKSDHFCKKCEKKFKNLFVKRYHPCAQKTEYAGPKQS